MVRDFDGILEFIGLVLASQDLSEMALAKLVDGHEFLFEPGLRLLLLLLVNVAAHLLWLHLLALLLRTRWHELGDLWNLRRHFRMLTLSVGQVVAVVGVQRAADDRLVVHRGVCARDLGVAFEQLVMVVVDRSLGPVAHKGSKFVTGVNLGLVRVTRHGSRKECAIEA